MKQSQLDVLFTPAEFETLPGTDLSGTTCVIFDVLRATSTIVTALAHGAEYVVPAASIEEALLLARQHHPALLAGERHGVRITAEITGGTDFHLGNSPREFLSEHVTGRRIITTTTNGTRALRACSGAREILVGSLLNLSATAHHIRSSPPQKLLLICGGTYEEASYEDALGAGALALQLTGLFPDTAASDSALIARLLYAAAAPDLVAAFGKARNGHRLLQIPELADDVALCATTDLYNFPCLLGPDGCIRRVQPASS